jgi:putative flippase GtrA
MMAGAARTRGELVRFAVVGLASTALYFAALLIGVRAGAPASVAGLIAYIVIMGLNYLAQRWWTFRSKRAHRSSLVRFAGTHVVGVGLNTLTLGVLVDALGIALVVGQGVALALVFAWSYLAQKFFVFAPTDDAAD